MGNSINPGITGDTFGVVIDTTSGTVTVSAQIVIESDRSATQLFLSAYRMGREHKKMEIQKVLSVT